MYARTRILAVEARVRRLGIAGMDTTPDRRVPDGDFLRVLGVPEDSGWTRLNSVLPEENSRYRGDHITIELGDPQRNGSTSGPKDSERLG